MVDAGDLLVFNDTRVIRARLFGHKESGGQIEVLIERIVDARHAVAQIRASKVAEAGQPDPSRRRHPAQRTRTQRRTGRVLRAGTRRPGRSVDA
jgi:S-adenosylmethionine:tRNA-ribosyltransferase-isomerase (queuine synthetase)